MPFSRAKFFLFILFFGCTPQAEKPSVSTSTDEQMITEVSAARAKAFSQSDAEGIAQHFTDDAILMAPSKDAMVGKDSVRAYYQAIFDQYEPVLESHYEEVLVEGDLAYGRGEATVTLTPRGGGVPTVSISKYLNILRRQPDGSWKTTHDIWNSNDSEAEQSLTPPMKEKTVTYGELEKEVR